MKAKFHNWLRHIKSTRQVTTMLKTVMPRGEAIGYFHPITDEEAEDLDDAELQPAAPAAVPDETPAEPAAADTLAIDPGQLEAALEKAVEKAFAGKIEQILVSVVEKAVKNEISRLRDLLMDEE